MARLQENPIYATANAGYKLGASLPRRKKGVDINKYQNLTSTPTQQTPNATTPASFSNLGTISMKYGGSTNFEKFHPGIDIANKQGTPIPSFSGGVVSKVVTGQPWTPNKPSFGNYIIVTDPQGGKHRYSHLYQTYVKVGQPVTRGLQLGTMGHTGGAYSPSGGDPSHLDYRIRDAYGKYVNPMVYLSQLQQK